MENQDRGSARTSRRQFISVAGLAATAVITLATSSTASAACTAPNPGSRVGDPAEARAVQRVAETLLNSGVPSLAFAIVKPDEKNRKASVTTTYHYGHADVENGVRVTPRTQFEIASETKTFTAALLAKLIARGEVGLDDLASKDSDGNPLPKGSGGEEIRFVNWSPTVPVSATTRPIFRQGVPIPHNRARTRRRSTPKPCCGKASRTPAPWSSPPVAIGCTRTSGSDYSAHSWQTKSFRDRRSRLSRRQSPAKSPTRSG